jgi:hypothetical protein
MFTSQVSKLDLTIPPKTQRVQKTLLGTPNMVFLGHAELELEREKRQPLFSGIKGHVQVEKSSNTGVRSPSKH